MPMPGPVPGILVVCRGRASDGPLSDVVKVVIIVVAVGVVAWWVKFRILPARAEQKRREAEGK